MDGFNDNFEVNNEADPAAEFLAREQDNLAGLEDDIKPVVTNGISSDEESSFLAGGENENDSGFEIVNHSSYGTNVNAGGFDINNDLEAPTSTSPTPLSQPQVPREEPEKIKRWREEQKKRLEEKDLQKKRRKKQKESARKELEDWYKGNEDQVAKNRKANRSAEKELVADTEPIEPGTEWERIAKLCDFNPKGSKHSKDISRMRSIILQVKQNPPIPSSSRQ